LKLLLISQFDVIIQIITRPSGENQTEDSGTNGRNLRSTVDPVGSIRLLLSTRAAMPARPLARARSAQALDHGGLREHISHAVFVLVG
jgi:hypothetical protein